MGALLVNLVLAFGALFFHFYFILADNLPEF